VDQQDRLAASLAGAVHHDLPAEDGDGNALGGRALDRNPVGVVGERDGGAKKQTGKKQDPGNGG
jgi:hypothetical protein